jgi:hypothetical protein
MGKIYVLAIALFLISNLLWSQKVQTSGSRSLNYNSPPGNCIDEATYLDVYKLTKEFNIPNALFPLYIWPLENSLNNGFILVNYVDDDPSSNLIDYNSGVHTYNGHNGTDICLYNFHAMDRGVKIIAAALGTVVATSFNAYDRNWNWNGNPPANYVYIQNTDGTQAWYYHMRKNSVTVHVGESVQTGQFIGLVGSSGFSTDSHLHFETGSYSGSNWIKRDPWNGSYNTLPGLWVSQEPYVGNLHLRIFDMGVFNQASCGGNLNNIPDTCFKERMTQPNIFGANEPYIAFWIEIQGLQGDAYTLEIRKPDSSLYNNVNYSLTGKYRYGWNYWYWSFGNIPSSDYGMWYARVLISGNEVKKVNFQVGASTQYAPRFKIAGRSYRINGSVQRDTLRIYNDGSPATYSLLNTPPFVTLVNDSIITIGATSNQPYRSTFFRVLATNSANLTDTMFYHIVDTTKQLDPIGIKPISQNIPAEYFLYQNFPNPFNPSTNIGFRIFDFGLVSLKIYDVLGREVATLVNDLLKPGEYRIDWNASNLPSGVYFYTLKTNRFSDSKKMLMIK